MTASSSASVFRPTYRNACPASAANSKRRRGREFEEFPELVSYLTRRFPNVSRQQNAPQAQGEIHYHDTSAVEREIALYKRIAGEGKPFAELFMTAPSPGIIADSTVVAPADIGKVSALPSPWAKKSFATEKQMSFSPMPR